MKNEKEIAKSNLEMLKSYAKEFIHHGMELQKALKKETEIDAWVVAKAERATTDLSDITHYLDGKSEYEQGGEIDERESRFQRENELLDSVDKDYVIVMYNKKSGKNEILTSPDTFKTQRYRYTSLMNKQELAGFEKIKIVQLQDLDFTYEYDGELFAKGGKLDKKATYVPKRDIAEVEVEKNGKTKFVDGADLLDGVYVKKSKFAKGGKADENLENYSDYDTFYDVVFEYIKREENLTEAETKNICNVNESIIEAEFDGGSSPRFTGDVILAYLSNERGYMANGGKLRSKAKYIPNRNIDEIEVTRNGKTTSIDGANLLDGVYVKKGTKFAKGGKTNTNSKEVREAVRKHILESVYHENEKEFKNFDEASKYLAEEFKRVADYKNNQAKFPNNQDRFTDYLKGIPFHFEYTNEGLEKFLNGLGINPTNKEYTGDQMWKLYGALIWKEVYPKYSKYAEGGNVNRSDSGQLNGMYLDSLSEEKKKEILTTIAKHYHISLEEANEEVRDSDAELLFEYTSSNETLSLKIYKEIKDMITTYAKGGQVSTYKKANWRFW
jgi:hypothetical protein